MPFSSYISLVKSHSHLLCFGFLLSFSSSFGQTYFIGVFGPSIHTEFGLTHTMWGIIYLVSTLSSAIVLLWTGSLIDRFQLSSYTLIVSVSLIVACLVISLSSGVTSLIIAIFLLRQFGQALTPHIAATTMARNFETERGRALAIATMGSATGEAFLPFLAVVAISLVGWRWTYVSSAIFLGIVLVPLSLYLLSKVRGRLLYQDIDNQKYRITNRSIRSWTRSEVLRDTRFYLLVPGYLAPSIVTTALFLHHLTLADSKDWSYVWVTGNYIIYAISVVVTALVSGPLIDYFRAVRLMPLSLIPLIFALLLVALFDNHQIVIPYMMMLGVSAGLVHTAASAMWPELYGLKHLGAIKILGVILMVFGSALGPVTLGALIDIGSSIETVCVLFAIYSSLSGILMYIAFRNLKNYRIS